MIVECFSDCFLAIVDTIEQNDLQRGDVIALSNRNKGDTFIGYSLGGYCLEFSARFFNTLRNLQCRFCIKMILGADLSA